MTYRNKLLLKRLLLIFLIAVAVIFVLLLVGYTYLGRYVIYTEDGAYFSFHSQPPQERAHISASKPDSVTLTTGAPVAAAEVLGDNTIYLEDHEVHGLLVDYETLSAGTELDKVDLGADGINTLVLEMRIADQPLLSSMPIQRLIDRAKNQDTWLVAVLACLSQSDYGRQHRNLLLSIGDGEYWIDRTGTYILDPGNEETINYVAGLVKQLAEMGFDEVVLNDFFMPTTTMLKYDYQNRTPEQILINAYQAVEEATSDYCKLGLLVQDPSWDTQGDETAERLYVCYNVGATVKTYAEAHNQQYLVFLTDSHDTRFDEYGKIEASPDWLYAPTEKEELGIDPETFGQKSSEDEAKTEQEEESSDSDEDEDEEAVEDTDEEAEYNEEDDDE